MRGSNELSAGTKTLWGIAGVVGAWFSLLYFTRVDNPHPPSADERAQIDGILRPAAVEAAGAAITLYASKNGEASVEKPQDFANPKEAQEILIRDKRYLLVVDIAGQLDGLKAENVYNLEIYQGEQSGGILITKENLDSDYAWLERDFLTGNTADGRSQVDLHQPLTSLEFRQMKKAAQTLAAQADADVSYVLSHDSDGVK